MKKENRTRTKWRFLALVLSLSTSIGLISRAGSDFGNLITIANEVDSKRGEYFTSEERMEVSMATQLSPPTIQEKLTPPFEVTPNLDLMIQRVSLITPPSSNHYHLAITYTTGDPKVQVVDRPLNFDIRVEGYYREYPVGTPPGLKSEPPGVAQKLELVNRRVVLEERHVVLHVSLPPWPHYLTGVHVWITINPDRSIREKDYENNKKHFYLWERERNYFKIHPWPSTTNPIRIFLYPWMNPPFADWIGNTFAFNESMARYLINKGYFKYLPAVNGDMLQVPMTFAVAKHCSEPKRTKLFVRYITFNGPRTYESHIDFDGPTAVKVVTVPLLLRIQRENFLDVSLENGPAYGRLNMRFDHLPWNLD